MYTKNHNVLLFKNKSFKPQAPTLGTFVWLWKKYYMLETTNKDILPGSAIDGFNSDEITCIFNSLGEVSKSTYMIWEELDVCSFVD